MDIVKKEIREALLGDLVPLNRRLVVSGINRVKFRNGLREGFGSVFFLGVMCSRRWYMTAKSAKQIRELAVKAMQDMGRMMLLQSLPEAEAVYCTYVLNHPCILTFTQGKDGIIEVAAYSARDFSGLLATYRTLNRFQKILHGILERMSEESEQKKKNALREQDQKEKQAKKQAKLDKKQAKKQAKLDKKQAKVDQKQAKKQNTVLALLQETVKLPFADRLKKKRQNRDVSPNEKQDVKQELEKQVQSAAVLTEPEETDFAAVQAAATEAKLMAEAAEARLAAAEARLAAEQAQAKLARMQEQLAQSNVSAKAPQSNAQAQAPQSNAQAQALQADDVAQTETVQTTQMSVERSGAADDHQGSSNIHSGDNTRSSNSRKKNRKKKK